MSACILRPTKTSLTISLLFFAFQFAFPATGQAQLVDAIRGWFRDPLIHAINKGLKPDGDLAWELSQLEGVDIYSQEQAEAILRAVASLPQLHGQNTQAWDTVEGQVADLFLAVNDTDSPAYILLWRHGIPDLLAHYQSLRQKGAEQLAAGQLPDYDAQRTLANLLLVLAQYQTREGTDSVIQAAREGVAADSYYWYSIFNCYTIDHPHSERLFAELRQALPVDDIAESLLDAANSLATDDADFPHPFATPAGLIRLKKWLSSKDSLDEGRAQSAAGALGFIDLPQRDVLLDLAAQHPQLEVRMAAAWSAAHAGLDRGFDQLVEYCRDVHCSLTARGYLEEFERPDLIPAEALEPKFAALAEFSNWLQNEYEIGRAADDLELLDQRSLPWLDSDGPIQVSLVRYRAAGQTPLDLEQNGVGIVGPMTWSFFSDDIQQLPIEDIYAIHCAFEAIQYGNISEIEASDFSDDNTRVAKSLIKQWSGAPLEQVELQTLHDFEESYLAYPQPQVAVATARRTITAESPESDEAKPDAKLSTPTEGTASEAGFIVYDGPRSRWYPAQEFPASTSAQTILRMHVGRQLLGFEPVASRSLRPLPPPLEISPETIVDTYEGWLQRLDDAEPDRRSDLLDTTSDLGRHYDKYIAAKSRLSGQSTDDWTIITYQRLLAAAQQVDPQYIADTLDSGSLIGEKFNGYVQIIALQHPQTVATLIKLLETHWDHARGRSLLGTAAWQAGLRDEAQRLFELHLSRGDTSEYFGKDWRILAEIWHSQGQTDKARQLLDDTIAECRTALGDADLEDSDYQEYRQELQENLDQHLKLYHTLFGEAQ